MERRYPDVPRLFTLDRELKMPRGFGYQAEQGRIACPRLDNQGRPERACSNAGGKRAGGDCGGD